MKPGSLPEYPKQQKDEREREKKRKEKRRPSRLLLGREHVRDLRQDRWRHPERCATGARSADVAGLDRHRRDVRDEAGRQGALLGCGPSRRARHNLDPGALQCNGFPFDPIAIPQSDPRNVACSGGVCIPQPPQLTNAPPLD